MRLSAMMGLLWSFAIVSWLWLAHLPQVASTEKISVFDLVAVNGTTRSPTGQYVYGLELVVGSPGQNFVVSPSLYLPYMSADLDIDTPGQQPELYLPSKALCEMPIAETDWNKFSAPHAGQFISMDAEGVGPSVGMFLVKWKKTSDVDRLNLTLRKGHGNATVIEMNINNDGDYPWNVTRTVQQNSFRPGNDYSLMLWSDDPPRRSISPMFSLGYEEPESNKDEDGPSPGEVSTVTCLDFLRYHGGYYNDTADLEYVPREAVSGFYSSRNLSWIVNVEGGGSTNVSWEPLLTQLEPGSGEAYYFNMSDVPIAKFTQATEGMGAVGLAALQKRRTAQSNSGSLASKSRSIAENVVGLYLGIDDTAGSVVMGGYNNALVDRDRSLVYDRIGEELYVEMPKVRFNGNGKSTKKEDAFDIQYSRQGVQLSYVNPGIRLPRKILDTILPKVGNPMYDDNIGYYVYSSDPPLDWSLTLTFRNETRDFQFEVPATSLLATVVDENNPLSTTVENGQTILRLTPTLYGDEEGAYLGRSVLKHLYVVDDNSLGKFLVSAANMTAAMKRERNVVTGSYMLIAGNSVTQLRTDKNIGPILGGSLGGAALLAVIAAGVAFLVARRRSAQEANRFNANGATKIRSNSPEPPADPEKNYHELSARSRGDPAYGSFMSGKALEAAFPLPPDTAPSSATNETFESSISQARLSGHPAFHHNPHISTQISPLSSLVPTAGTATWPRRGSRNELAEARLSRQESRISRYEVEAESPHYFQPHPPPPAQHIARLLSYGSLKNTASTQSLPVTPDPPVHASRTSTIQRHSRSEMKNSNNPSPAPSNSPSYFPQAQQTARGRRSNHSLQIMTVDLDTGERSLSRTASIARVVSPREIALSPTRQSSIRRKSDHGLLLRRPSEREAEGHRRVRSDGHTLLDEASEAQNGESSRDGAARSGEVHEMEVMGGALPEWRELVLPEMPGAHGSDGARSRGRPSSELEGWGGMERR